MDLENHKSRTVSSFVAAGLLLAACSTSTAGPQIVAGYVSVDGLTIELEVDTCNANLVADVTESAATVEVVVAAANDTGDDCLDGIAITLEEPLGDRDLIDRSDGETVQVIEGTR